MKGAALVRSDAIAIPLGDNTVDLIVTSPPYFALRSYQDGGEHYGGQIGSEATPTAFLEALWAVTAECWRVLKPTGSLFVNLGDKYAGTGGGNSNGGLSKPDKKRKGWDEANNPMATAAHDNRSMPKNNSVQTTGFVRAKSLMGLPWRYAIGCIDGQADPDGRGWVLRSEIIWSKSNGFPESVTDRVRRSHEQFFHLTKEGRYYSNVDEVREPHADESIARTQRARISPDESQIGVGSPNTLAPEQMCNPLGKLPGSVWTVPTQPLIVPDWLDVDHFAAFPTEGPRRLILGWSPPGICVECGEGRRAVVERKFHGEPNHAEGERQRVRGALSGGVDNVTLGRTDQVERTITGTACACDKPTAPTTPAVVLDPFSGTGTVAGVARALGRYGVGCDLSADYMRLARWRIWQSGMGAKVESRTNGERQGVLL